MEKKFKSLNDLLKHVEKQAQLTLKNEVAETAVNALSETVQEETYVQYTPSGENPYERRGTDGGLADKRNYQVEMLDDNTISIENLTTGNSKYPGSIKKAIDGIVVYGTGYTWKHSKIYSLQPFPRDFYGGTVRRLKNTGVHIEAFKRGMKARGIIVK